MNLLMISGDRSLLEGKRGAFWYTLEAFSKEWDRIDIICPKPSKETAGTRTFFGNVHFYPNPRGLIAQSSWIAERGAALYKDRQYAVMTVHEFPPFYNGRGARKLAKKTGIPCILEVHHIVGYPKAGSWKETVGRWMSRWYLPYEIQRSTAVRMVSKSAAETLMKWGLPLEKLSVVPSFYLDRAFFASLGASSSTQYDVVFCGRLVENKGIAELFRAIALLPRASLLVIGDGPLRSNLKSLTRTLGIEHRVEFRGWLPSQEDVMRAVRSAKMLVMNSLSEGGPRVPLEAMAAGVPVVVTKVGVMPDVIVDGLNGLFTTGEPKDLAEKIDRLLTNEDLRIRIAQEGTKILDRFERGRLITQYAQFLKSFSSHT